MLRKIAAFALCLLAACGGEKTPTPPPSAVAASVVIDAGDQQSGASQGAVPVAPSVRVRDAAGKPVSGVAVQFTVTAGGGTVEGGSQTTNTDGIARVTAWRLGTAGDQTLTAQVANLPPATFRATILAGSDAIDANVGAAGGTFEITTAGHPYRGLKLTVPQGSFTAAQQWQVRVVSTPALPTLPVGYRVAGPVLEIATEQPRAAHVMTLDIPIARTAGRATVIALYDPTRRTMEVLPTVARTDSSIRVVTTHLRADLLLGPAVAASRTMSSGRLIPIVNLVPFELLLPVPSVPLLINPATDHWPVLDNGSVKAPGGHSLAVAALEALNLARGGPPLASVVKGLSEPGFYAEAAPLATILLSLQRLGGSLGPLQELNTQLRALPKPERDQLVSEALAANLALRGTTPVLFTTGAQTSQTYANAVAVSGTQTVTIVSGSRASPIQIDRTPAIGFGTTPIPPTADGQAQNVDGLLPLPSAIFAFEQIGDLLADLTRYASLSGTARTALSLNMEQRAGLPGFAELGAQQSSFYNPGPPYFIPDSVLVIYRMAKSLLELKLGGGALLADPRTGAVMARSVARQFVIGEGGALSEVPEGVRTPAVISVYEIMNSMLRPLSSWTIDVTRLPYRVSPDTVTLSGTTRDVQFDAAVPEPPAKGFRIKWDWGDGTTSENLGLTKGTHTYQTQGKYRVISTLLSADTRAVEGVDTVDVKTDALPYWQITTFVDADSLLESAQSAPLADLLNRIVAVPQSALVAIDEYTSGHTAVRLRVLSNATWSAATCCPPTAELFLGEQPYFLGRMPEERVTVGPFFAGYETTRWAQSTTDLGSGTLTSQFVDGLTTYAFKDAASQVGPRSVMRINATRNGTAMTGTITVTAWLFDPDTGNIDQSGPAVFRFPFTATRIK